MSYSAILPGLYLGDYDSQKHSKVDAIINVSEYSVPTSYNFPMTLSNFPDTERNFKLALDTLTSLLRDNNSVLVHCLEGVSRSASVILAYLMRELKMPYEQAINLLKMRRNCVNINPKYLQLALNSISN